MNPEWHAATGDPALEGLRAEGAEPGLDEILRMFPRPAGEPAFDPDEIEHRAQRLETHPKIATGHPFVDRSVRVGLAHIDATFQGDHPKYGVKSYAQVAHDAFPPIIIAAVDALSAWGLAERAKALFHYWLLHFVRDDGTIDYYGPAISEHGQLLHTAVLLAERGGMDGWWHECFAPLDRMANHLLALRSAAEKEDGLIIGGPEADEKDHTGKYFHNNAWAARGLREWADLCDRVGPGRAPSSEAVRHTASSLQQDTLRAIDATWPREPADWWLSPMVEPVECPEHLTATRLASYTNYRYWPELLSSGILPPSQADRIINARLAAGGQFCGMTRFLDRLDDWPLTDYLNALWELGRKREFLLSLHGHIALHQAAPHLTAYEQVTFPPGREKAPYCLPCQLVAARAARLIV